MRIVLSLILASLLITACKKNKFTTVPQIKFKSIDPDHVPSNLLIGAPGAPKMTIGITDSEGDLGFIAGKDTSRVYVKNLSNLKIDSFFLPNINADGKKNFEADLTINLQPFLLCKPGPPPAPRTDTVYFEVYIKDFAKNKSNVIKSEKPLYIACQ